MQQDVKSSLMRVSETAGREATVMASFARGDKPADTVRGPGHLAPRAVVSDVIRPALLPQHREDVEGV